MPLAAHVCSVSGNVCFKFHVNILYGFRVMDNVNDFAQISTLQKGHNSMIIKARGMSLASHVCIVSGNVCSKFDVNILIFFRVMAKIKDCAHISKSKRGHNSIIIKARSMPLAMHVCIVSGNVCFKFHVNILYGFRVMDNVNDFAQISTLQKGHNSMIIKARGMSLASHVCIVSGNVCSKFDVNILIFFRVMAKIKDCAHISKSKRGHNSIIIKARSMPLAMHVCIVSGNVCFKLEVDILYSFKVIKKKH